MQGRLLKMSEKTYAMLLERGGIEIDDDGNEIIVISVLNSERNDKVDIGVKVSHISLIGNSAQMSEVVWNADAVEVCDIKEG